MGLADPSDRRESPQVSGQVSARKYMPPPTSYTRRFRKRSTVSDVHSDHSRPPPHARRTRSSNMAIPWPIIILVLATLCWTARVSAQQIVAYVVDRANSYLFNNPPIPAPLIPTYPDMSSANPPSHPTHHLSPSNLDTRNHVTSPEPIISVIDSAKLDPHIVGVLRDWLVASGVSFNPGTNEDDPTESFILSVHHLSNNGFRISLRDATHAIDLAVQDAMLRFSKDQIALRDFALHTGGGDVIPSLTSNTFRPIGRESVMASLGQVSHPPVTALHPSLNVGDCWPFYGPHGTLGVTLSRRIIPTSISIDHAATEVLLDPSSAPKDVLVWGIVDSPVNRLKAVAYQRHVQKIAKENTHYQAFQHSKFGAHPDIIPLAIFTYDIHESRNVQTFPLLDSARVLNMDILQVIFEVRSNWGNPAFTCLYRVRVHGEMESK